MKALRRVAIGVQKATGAKGITITQSNGQMAGQLVPHIHFHIIPRTEAEKGIGLEGVLPVKKQEESAMDSMASKISKSIPKARAPVREVREEPKETQPAEEKPEKKEPPKAERPESPEGQDINFDF
jgi:diadenosine tetraphosphate (Ap4A) HIT family hydrolase